MWNFDKKNEQTFLQIDAYEIERSFLLYLNPHVIYFPFILLFYQSTKFHQLAIIYYLLIYEIYQPNHSISSENIKVGGEIKIKL